MRGGPLNLLAVVVVLLGVAVAMVREMGRQFREGTTTSSSSSVGSGGRRMKRRKLS